MLIMIIMLITLKSKIQKNITKNTNQKTNSLLFFSLYFTIKVHSHMHARVSSAPHAMRGGYLRQCNHGILLVDELHGDRKRILRLEAF